MMIVGIISDKEEALEIENITKAFIVGRKARFLANKI
jgi:hypothetical protein